MVNVRIDLRDVGGEPTGKYAKRRDSVTVWAPTFRPASTGDYTVGPSPRTHYFDNSGRVTLSNIEEGPLVVQFDVRQMDGQDTFNVNVPGGTGTVSLRELLADQYEYTPVVISEARRILAASRTLLQQAQEARDGIGGDAEKALSRVRQSVNQLIDETKGQLDKVAKEVEANAAAAGERAQSAGSAATVAKKHLDGANNALKLAQEIQTQVGEVLGEVQSLKEEAGTSSTSAASSAQAAAQSKVDAGDFATAAGREAKAAETSAGDASKHLEDMKAIVDTTRWEDDVLFINGKPSPSLRGPKGDPGKSGASDWTAIDGKPTTFPPDAHTHKVADIADFPTIDTGVKPSVVVKRWKSGQISVPTQPDADSAAASKSYVDTTVDRIVDIPTNADLNTYTTTGRYHQPASANAGKGKNYPEPVAGLLEVFNSGAMTYQRYTGYGKDGKQYWRGRYQKTWGEWVQVANQKQLDEFVKIATELSVTVGDLQGSVENQLANFVPRSDMVQYAKTSALADYAKSSALTSYATKKELEEAIGKGGGGIRMEVVDYAPTLFEQDVLYLVRD